MPHSKRTRKRFEHYTPSSITDLAYCFHCISEPSQHPTWDVAKKRVDEFHRDLESAKRDTPDHAFIWCVAEIIVSLAKGISRSKRELNELLSKAKQEKEQKISQLAQDKKEAWKKSFLLKVARASLLGGFGYLLLKGIMPAVEMPEKANDDYISLATMCVLLLAGSFVDSYMTKSWINRISVEYDRDYNLAQEKCNRELLKEYTRAKLNAVLLWEMYTGKKRDWTFGYEMVLHEELQMHAKFIEQRAPSAGLKQMIVSAMPTFPRKKPVPPLHTVKQEVS